MKKELIEDEIHIYAVRDSHGNSDWDATSDPSNTIQICGMLDKDGKRLYFESDAYHLNDWCEENELVMIKDYKEFSILI